MMNIIATTIFLLLTISVNAQNLKSEFQKTVDSINAIIKVNKLTYYMEKNMTAKNTVATIL
jgi:hypothetical protein